MDETKVEGVKEQLKGVADFAVGQLFSNKDRELRGQIGITNGFKQKGSGRLAGQHQEGRERSR
jgi:hypothetical protein